MQITAKETRTYAEALSLPVYTANSPGEQHVELFASLVSPGASVLDAGCGTGKGMVALAAKGFHVHGVDLTYAGLVPEAQGFYRYESSPSLWRFRSGHRYDYVYCTDVLEHIPPHFTMLVVSRLLEAASGGVFLSVSLIPDVMGVWVGQVLHQSVRRYDEWLADFKEIARVTDARDLGIHATFFLEPL